MRWEHAGCISVAIETQHAIDLLLGGVWRNDGTGKDLLPSSIEDRFSTSDTTSISLPQRISVKVTAV